MLGLTRRLRRRLPKPALHKAHMQSPRFGLLTWNYVASALVLGFTIPRINQWLFPWLLSPLSKDAIVTILSSIAAGMITLTGIVFSLVFVIVQFGSSTYSPRITRIFAHTFPLRHSLGIFTGTFLYSLMALRTIGLERGESVTALTVWLAFLWLLASVAILASLVRVFTTLTIGNVLAALGLAGRLSIVRLYESFQGDIPELERTKERGEPSETQSVVYQGEPGYIIQYHIERLVTLARETNSLIDLPYAIGDALRDGQPIAIIRGATAAIAEKRIYASLVLGRERGFRYDPRYAMRLLVDMAIRALSPAINDPTTAVQALDHLEMLLHRLGNAHLQIGEVRDDEGKVRVRHPAPDWEDFLRLGLAEIMQYGAASLQVQRRLAALLAFLSRTVPPSRAAAVERLADERLALASRAFDKGVFADWANVRDHGGLSGAGDR